MTTGMHTLHPYGDLGRRPWFFTFRGHKLVERRHKEAADIRNKPFAVSEWAINIQGGLKEKVTTE